MSKGSAKRSAKSAAPSVPAKRYEPTPNEQAALDAFKARQAARAPSPHLKVSGKGNVAELAPDHPDGEIAQNIMMESLGSADRDFVDGLLAQAGLLCLDRGTHESERQLNFILSVVRSIKPRDEIEAMLGAQMATVHMASMTFARRLAHVDNIAQQDSAERAFNKLTRTFTTQVEALKRYRTGGEQRVTVQHVNVNEGGQAIVGNVSGGGGVPQKKVETTS